MDISVVIVIACVRIYFSAEITFGMRMEQGSVMFYCRNST